MKETKYELVQTDQAGFTAAIVARKDQATLLSWNVAPDKNFVPVFFLLFAYQG